MTTMTDGRKVTRFQRDPQWSKRFSRTLRLLTPGDPTPTETERQRCADALLAIDDVGAALARSIAADKTTSMRQFRTALDDGIEAVDDPSPELAAFFDAVSPPPEWFDPERAARGAHVCLRAGQTGLDVLGTGALMSGYRSSATTRQLAATGRLTGSGTKQRVAETTRWWYECVRPGGIEPGAAGWRLTLHVRLMHALVNRRLESRPDWDVSEWGRPVNQADQAATLALFSTSFLIQTRALGRVITRREGADVMHLWRYVGWLLGVDEQWLTDDEGVGRRHLYHLALFAPGPDEYSRELAASLAAFWGSGNYRFLQSLHRRIDGQRLLSLQRVFAGRGGLTELGLPVVPPWWLPLAAVGNVATSVPAAVLPGARWLEHKLGDRVVSRWLDRNEHDRPKAGTHL